jgi:hypothetical protein
LLAVLEATPRLSWSSRGAPATGVEHQPAPDVAYQAGVDVHGRPVAPADLDGGSNLAVPEVIAIPLEILVQDKYGIPANSVLWEAKAQVGTVVVVGDQIYYEGQLLGDTDRAALARACRDLDLAR